MKAHARPIFSFTPVTVVLCLIAWPTLWALEKYQSWKAKR